MHFHVVYWESGGKTAPAVIDQISGAVFGKSGATSIAYLITQFFTAANGWNLPIAVAGNYQPPPDGVHFQPWQNRMGPAI